MSADSPSRPTCAVLGSPIAHSLSPVLHRAAYDALELDWDYQAHDITGERLPGFVAGLGAQWRGLSLTMPLKEAVIGLCDHVESLGRLLRSINTVVIDRNGVRWGHNTDVPGLVAALRGLGVWDVDSAVVVGAGATAASALAAFAHLGGHSVTIAARSPRRAEVLLPLAEPLGLELSICGFEDLVDLRAVDVVVSTIPAEGQAPIADRVAGLAAVVLDVIYAPLRTPVLAAVEARGGTSIGGFELLLHQAGRQVELMTGAAAAPLPVMRAAGLGALARQ